MEGLCVCLSVCNNTAALVLCSPSHVCEVTGNGQAVQGVGGRHKGEGGGLKCIIQDSLPHRKVKSGVNAFSRKVPGFLRHLLQTCAVFLCLQTWLLPFSEPAYYHRLLQLRKGRAYTVAGRAFLGFEPWHLWLKKSSGLLSFSRRAWRATASPKETHGLARSLYDLHSAHAQDH